MALLLLAAWFCFGGVSAGSFLSNEQGGSGRVVGRPYYGSALDLPVTPVARHAPAALLASWQKVLFSNP